MDLGSALHIASEPSSCRRLNGAHRNGFKSENGAGLAAAPKPREAAKFDTRLPTVGLNTSDYARLLVCSGCGFIFGIAAEKARSMISGYFCYD